VHIIWMEYNMLVMIFDMSRFNGNHHLFTPRFTRLPPALVRSLRGDGRGEQKNSGGIHHDIHGEFVLESSIRYVFSLVVLSNGYYICLSYWNTMEHLYKTTQYDAPPAAKLRTSP